MDFRLFERAKNGWFYLLGILLIGGILRLWHMGWGLPELYEEAMPLQIQFRFWPGGTGPINLNPHFFIYPAFMFYLQFLLQGIHYLLGHLVGLYGDAGTFQQAFTQNPSASVLIARGSSIAFDMGSILIAYSLVKEYKNKQAGLIAALLVALNPLHIREAHLINVDTPLTFFVLLSLFFMQRMYEQGTTKWYTLAAISIGLATATKYNAGLLVFVFVLIHLLRSDSVREAITSLRQGNFLLGVGLIVLVFAAFNPYIFLDYGAFARQFGEVETHMEYGHLGLDRNETTFGYYFLDSLPRNLGWFILIISLLGAGYLIATDKRKSLLLVAFPLLYVATVGTWSARFDRYIFPIVPLLLAISSIAIMVLVERSQTVIGRVLRIRDESQNSLRRVLIGGILVIATLQPISRVLAYHRGLSYPDTRWVTKAWIINNLGPRSVVATGPFGIELPKDRLLTISIPFDAGHTEVTIPFYKPQWYEDLDLVITSDYDYARYLREPERFREILAFYDSLQTRWSKVFEIRPQQDQECPSFWLYQPPSVTSAGKYDTALVRDLVSRADSFRFVNFAGKLGLVLASRDKLNKAQQLLSQVVLVDPSNQVARNTLIEIYLKTGQSDAAIDELDRLLTYFPQDASALARKGDILLKEAKYADAERSFQSALDLNNRIEEAYHGLNYIYALRNDRPKVIANLQRFLATLPPDSKKAATVRATIEEISKNN